MQCFSEAELLHGRKSKRWWSRSELAKSKAAGKKGSFKFGGTFLNIIEVNKHLLLSPTFTDLNPKDKQSLPVVRQLPDHLVSIYLMWWTFFVRRWSQILTITLAATKMQYHSYNKLRHKTGCAWHEPILKLSKWGKNIPDFDYFVLYAIVQELDYQKYKSHNYLHWKLFINN